MASCYGKQGMASVSPAQQERENAVRRYLPMRTKLKDDTPVDIDYFRDRSVGRGNVSLAVMFWCAHTNMFSWVSTVSTRLDGGSSTTRSRR